jgi:hypothetical protein
MENGHSRSQSGATGWDAHKNMIAKDLEGEWKWEQADLEGTRTSKDYLCACPHVKFAAFSQR